MKRFVLAVLIVLACLPARADIDQHCLASCVSNGAATNADCISKCSYDINVAPKPVAIPGITAQSLEVHRTLPVPMLDPGTDILPQAPKPLPKPEKDPVCLGQCLHQGLQYDYCSERCVKTICPAGIVLCPKPQNSFAAPQPVR